MDLQQLQNILSDHGSWLVYDRGEKANLRGLNLTDFSLAGTDLGFADLRGAILSGVDLSEADLSGADLSDVRADGANLKNVELRRANLSRVDLSDANLEGANLSGANLEGALLKGAIGIGTKHGEIAFAQWLLSLIESGKGCLEMGHWHLCNTTHCLAGWYAPDLSDPSAIASRHLPTLAQYFYVSNELALAALRRVASGEESVFN